MTVLITPALLADTLAAAEPADRDQITANVVSGAIVMRTPDPIPEFDRKDRT